MLYRGILKGAKSYPSKNRAEFCQAIVEEINDWKQLPKDSEEAKKAIKKMRMLYGHVGMWNIKMQEVL